jgi:hypothetical protein
MTTASILLAKALLPSTGPVNAKLSRRRGIMAALMVGAARSGDRRGVMALTTVSRRLERCRQGLISLPARSHLH